MHTLPFQLIVGPTLGKEGSSWQTIGSINAGRTLGQAKVNAFVNTATGNCYLEDHHKYIQFLGFTLAVGFVYNTQTTAWQLSCLKNLNPINNQLNTANSTVLLTNGDGSIITFNYDTNTTRYIATHVVEGNEYLTVQGDGKWLLNYSATGVTEIYDEKGWLVERADAVGRKLTFLYDSLNILQSITDSNGQMLNFDYQGQKLGVYLTIDSKRTLLQWYECDARYNIKTTHIPLSDCPQEDYLINYTTMRNGAGWQLAVNQTDGTLLQVNSIDGKSVTSIADGENHTWDFSYQQQKVIVVDGLNNKTILETDADNQLSGLSYTDKDGQVVAKFAYAYKSTGQLAKIIYADGINEEFSYEKKNNLLAAHRIKAGSVLIKSNVFLRDANGVCYQQLAQSTNSSQEKHIAHYFFHNDKRQLIFAVSPLGAVTQYDYDNSGNCITTREYLAGQFDTALLNPADGEDEQHLQIWCKAQDQTQIKLTEDTYNERGQVTDRYIYSKLDQNGKGDLNNCSYTNKTWDAFNNWLRCTKLQQVNPTVELTQIQQYDGLQRLIYAEDALNQITTYVYESNQVTTTRPNGLIQTQQWNKAGQVVQHAETAGSLIRRQQLIYDAVGRVYLVAKSDGQNYYTLYNAHGVLEYEIDPLGYVTQYFYNAQKQKTKTVHYANKININNTDYSSIVAVLTQLQIANLQDRHSTKLWDAAEQLRYEIDGEGAVKEYQYDGINKQPTRELHYANPLDNNIARVLTNGVLIGIQPDAVHDYDCRNFYDNDGYLLGKQRAAGLNINGQAIGYVTEYVRNTQGYLLEKIKYKNPSPLADDLTAAIPVNAAKENKTDYTKHYYYRDNKGRLLAEVDAIGRFIEYKYTANDLLQEKRSYANYPVQSDPANTADYNLLRPAADIEDQILVYTYDAQNREIKSELQPFGKIIETQYDTAGNKIYVAIIDAKDPSTKREHYYRYNAWRQVSAELNERCAANYAKLTTDDEREEFWQKYAINYEYNNSGLKIKKTDPLGAATLYIYDSNNRETLVIDAIGAVIEKTYNGFNQIQTTTVYEQKLTSVQLKTLQNDLMHKGFISAELHALIAVLKNPTKDRMTTADYYRNGLIKKTMDAEGYTLEKTYNGRNSLVQEKQLISAEDGIVIYRTDSYEFDQRGLEIKTVQDVDGLNIATQHKYDLHALPCEIIDAYGNVHNLRQDDVGRTVTTVDPYGTVKIVSFDAFDRPKTETIVDKTTQHIYETDKRMHTLVSPDSLFISTQKNVFAETISVTDINGTTQTMHGPDGQVEKMINAEGCVTEDTFDLVGHHIQHKAANGLITLYEHDEVGSVQTQIEDPKTEINPSGKNIAIHYEHNTNREVISSTNAKGVITTRERDRRGLEIKVTVDPNGLSLQSQYQYNGLRNCTDYIQGDKANANQRHTRTTFDVLGRETATTIDPKTAVYPHGLALITTKTLDAVGNVIAIKKPKGNVARYIFDKLNRLRFQIDPKGGVTEFVYDKVKCVTHKRIYANKIDLTLLTDKSTSAELEEITQPMRNDEVDQCQYSFYNKDNKLIYCITGSGQVTQYYYYGARKVGKTEYATCVEKAELAKLITLTDYQAVAAYIKANQIQDRTTRFILDKIGQVRFKISAIGAVTEQRFDQAGYVVATIKYNNRIDITKVNSSTVPEELASLIITSELDRAEYEVYNALNQKIFVIDAANNLTQLTYDEDDNLVEKCLYADPIQALPLSIQALARNIDGNDISTQSQKMLQANILSIETIQKLIRPDNKPRRITAYKYDKANRKTDAIDGLGFKEKFIYDALDQLRAHIDKLNYQPEMDSGSIDLKYAYENVHDRAGRRINELTPETDVVVTQIDSNNPANILAAQPVRAKLETITTYDDNGNTKGIAHAAKLVDGSRLDPRAIEFTYDECDQQVGTVQIAVPVNDPSNMQPTLGERPEQLVNLTTQTVYDAQKLPIIKQDKNDHYHFNVYAAGQLKYAVDHEGHVIEYARNAFNEVVLLQSYAAPLTHFNAADYAKNSNGISLIDVINNLKLDSDNDRVIATDYDQEGHKVSITLAEVFMAGYANDQLQLKLAQSKTVWVRNTFGEIISKSQLVNPIDNTYAYTLKWYDSHGKLIATVDPKGYVTLYERNQDGLVSRESEYAQAIDAQRLLEWQLFLPSIANKLSNKKYSLVDKLSALTFVELKEAIKPSPKDRHYSYTYNCQGHMLTKTAEKAITQVVTQNLDGTAKAIIDQIQDLTTSYARNPMGEITVTTLPSGATKIKQYDALNRLSAEIELPRTTENSDKTTPMVRPVIAHHYNSHGNESQTSRYTIEVKDESISAALARDIKKSLLEITQLNLFDVRGLTIAQQDAEGGVQYKAYSGSGKQARTWSFPTVWQQKDDKFVRVPQLKQTRIAYNSSDKQIGTYLLEYNVIDGKASEVSTVWKLNAFGETIAEDTSDNTTGVAWPLQIIRDKAGRIYLTNKNGGVYEFNLADGAGRLVATIRSRTQDLSQKGPADIPALLAQDYTQRQLVKLIRDLNGNVIEQHQAAFKKQKQNTAAPIYTVFAVGEDYLDFGKFSLSWPAPAVESTVIEIKLWIVDENEASAKTFTATRKDGRVGIDISALPTDKYSYELTYYYLDPASGQKGQISNQVRGQISLVTPNTKDSKNLVMLQKDESTLIFAGKTTNEHGEELSGVELIQNGKSVAKLAVSSTDIASCYKVNLSNYVSGKYRCHLIYGSQPIKQLKIGEVDPVTSMKLEIQATILRGQTFLNIPSIFKKVCCVYLLGEGDPANLQVSYEKIETNVVDGNAVGLFQSNYFRLYGLDESGKNWYITQLVVEETSRAYVFANNKTKIYLTNVSAAQPLFLRVLNNGNFIKNCALEPWANSSAIADIAGIEDIAPNCAYEIMQLSDNPAVDLGLGEFSIYTEQRAEKLYSQEISIATSKRMDKPFLLVSNPFARNILKFTMYAVDNQTILGSVYYSDLEKYINSFGNPLLLLVFALKYGVRLTISVIINLEEVVLYDQRKPPMTDAEIHIKNSVIYLAGLPEGVGHVELQYNLSSDGVSEWQNFYSIQLSNQKRSVTASTLELDPGQYQYRLRAYNKDNVLMDLSSLGDTDADDWLMGDINITHDLGMTLTPKNQHIQMELIEPVYKQQYDRWENVTQETDVFGKIIDIDYNNANKVLNKSLPEVGVTLPTGDIVKMRPTESFGYNALYHVVAHKKPRGNITLHERDYYGKACKTTLPDGAEVSFIYDAYSNNIIIRDGNGKDVTQIFDKRNQLIEIIDACGWKKVFILDELCRKIGETVGASTTDEATTRYAHDARNNISKTWLPKGQLTVCTFNHNGKLIREDNGVDSPLINTFDYFGNLLQTDNKGANIIKYELNPYDKQVTHQTSSGDPAIPDQDQVYIYDDAGHLIVILDNGRGVTTAYQIDVDGERMGERFVAPDGKVHQEVTIVRDALKRIIEVRDTRIVCYYKYDQDNNRMCVDVYYYPNKDGDEKTKLQLKTQWYAYNPAGRMTVENGTLDTTKKAVVIAKEQGTALEYEPKTGRRITETTIDKAGVTQTATIKYLDNGYPNNKHTTPNGTQITFGWNPAGERVSYSNSAHGVSESAAYTNGQLSQQTTVTGGHTTITTFAFNNAMQAVGQENDMPEGNGIRYVDELTMKRQQKRDGQNKLDSVAGTRMLYQPDQDPKSSPIAVVALHYDANGNIQNISGDITDSFRDFIVNYEGRIILKTNGEFSSRKPTSLKREYYFYTPKGDVLGKFGDLPDTKGSKPFDFDFGHGYHPIGKNYPPAAPGRYVTLQDQTFAQISELMYGDASYASEIAHANHYSVSDTVQKGETLTIPNLPNTDDFNVAGDYTQYSEQRELGSTYPNMATPLITPPHHHESFWHELLEEVEIVAIVVVSVVLAAYGGAFLLGTLEGVMANAGLTVAAGTAAATVTGVAETALAYGIAGAAANVATQGLEIMFGKQNGFDLGEVGKAGLFSAMTAGMAKGLGIQDASMIKDLATFKTEMIKTIELATAVQGTSFITGQGFDWRKIVMAAVDETAAMSLAKGLDIDLKNPDTVKDVIYRSAKKIQSSVIQAALMQGPYNAENIAAQELGAAIGNAINSKIDEEFKVKEWAKKQEEKQFKVSPEQLAAEEAAKVKPQPAAATSPKAGQALSQQDQQSARAKALADARNQHHDHDDMPSLHKREQVDTAANNIKAKRQLASTEACSRAARWQQEQRAQNQTLWLQQHGLLQYPALDVSKIKISLAQHLQSEYKNADIYAEAFFDSAKDGVEKLSIDIPDAYSNIAKAYKNCIKFYAQHWDEKGFADFNKQMQGYLKEVNSTYKLMKGLKVVRFAGKAFSAYEWGQATIDVAHAHGWNKVWVGAREYGVLVVGGVAAGAAASAAIALLPEEAGVVTTIAVSAVARVGVGGATIAGWEALIDEGQELERNIDSINKLNY